MGIWLVDGNPLVVLCPLFTLANLTQLYSSRPLYSCLSLLPRQLLSQLSSAIAKMAFLANLNPAPALTQPCQPYPPPNCTALTTTATLAACLLYEDYVHAIHACDPNLQLPSSRALMRVVRYHLDFALFPTLTNAAAVNGFTNADHEGGTVDVTLAVALGVANTLHANLMFLQNHTTQNFTVNAVSAVPPLELVVTTIIATAPAAPTTPGESIHLSLLPIAEEIPAAADGTVVIAAFLARCSQFDPFTRLTTSLRSRLGPKVLSVCFGSLSGAAPNFTFGTSLPKFQDLPNLQSQVSAWRLGRFALTRRTPVINSRAALQAFINNFVASNPGIVGAMVARRREGPLFCLSNPTNHTTRHAFNHMLEFGATYDVTGFAGGIQRRHRCWSCRALYLYNDSLPAPDFIWQEGNYGDFGCAEPMLHMACL